MFLNNEFIFTAAKCMKASFLMCIIFKGNLTLNQLIN